MSIRALTGMVLALAAGVMIFLFIQTSSDGGSGTTINVGTRPAAAACPSSRRCLPDVAWLDTSGVLHTRADFAGKIVVVNFWATWCHPCELEIPDFVRVAARYREQLMILGVVMDSPRPDASALLNFMSDHDMTYPVIPVTDDIQRAFHDPNRYPTTYVFDRYGNERAWKIHPMSESELSAVVEGILHE